MSDYKTFHLHEKEFRYYNDTRIDSEFQNREGNWKPIKIGDKDIYKKISFTVNGKRYYVLLHRLIYFVNNPDWNIDDSKQQIDHISHPENEPLDNSITNLRCVTNQQNNFNRNGTIGCYWDNSKNKWRAQITVDGKKKHLGLFVEKQDAINAHQAAKLIHHIID